MCLSSLLFHFFLHSDRKAIHGEIKISTENGETRTLRCAPDWGVSNYTNGPSSVLITYILFFQETAINGDHLWVSTSASGDLCYVGESECSVSCCASSSIRSNFTLTSFTLSNFLFHFFSFLFHRDFMIPIHFVRISSF